MFHRRTSEFDPRVSSIVGHLRGIEQELVSLGNSAGKNASSAAASALDQAIDAIRPTLSELADRFRAGQRVAADNAISFGNRALDLGSQAGSEAIDQARERVVVTVAVALAVGALIGFVARRR
jgi:ElaB/YqjD/DUF883 family membrane-anchored ribosome-binding protein